MFANNSPTNIPLESLDFFFQLGKKITVYKQAILGIEVPTQFLGPEKHKVLTASPVLEPKTFFPISVTTPVIH